MSVSVKTESHRIRWFVYAGGEKIPRAATMRGEWPTDAECSCGWATKTGGAVRSYVKREVDRHKWDVANGFYEGEAS